MRDEKERIQTNRQIGRKTVTYIQSSFQTRIIDFEWDDVTPLPSPRPHKLDGCLFYYPLFMSLQLSVWPPPSLKEELPSLRLFDGVADA